MPHWIHSNNHLQCRDGSGGDDLTPAALDSDCSQNLLEALICVVLGNSPTGTSSVGDSGIPTAELPLSCSLTRACSQNSKYYKGRSLLMGFRGFCSVTWTMRLGVTAWLQEHVAGGGCSLDVWPEAWRGRRCLALFLLSLSSCCDSTVTLPSNTLCQVSQCIYLPSPNGSQDQLWSPETFFMMIYLQWQVVWI